MRTVERNCGNGCCLVDVFFRNVLLFVKVVVLPLLLLFLVSVVGVTDQTHALFFFFRLVRVFWRLPCLLRGTCLSPAVPPDGRRTYLGANDCIQYICMFHTVCIQIQYFGEMVLF